MKMSAEPLYRVLGSGSGYFRGAVTFYTQTLKALQLEKFATEFLQETDGNTSCVIVHFLYPLVSKETKF